MLTLFLPADIAARPHQMRDISYLKFPPTDSNSFDGHLLRNKINIPNFLTPKIHNIF